MTKKQEFLKKYNILNSEENMMDVAERIFNIKNNVWSLSSFYYDLINYNSHGTGGVNEKELEEFFLKLYKRYHWVCTEKYDFENSANFETRKEFCRDLKTKIELQPQNMTIEKFRSLFFDFESEYYKFSPINSQTGTQSPWHSESRYYNKMHNKEIEADYFHILPLFGEKVDCRLYLNIKAENIIKLASKFIDRPEYEEGLYFKFFTIDSRYETIVFYSSYENVQNIINMIMDIKEQEPKLFEGSEKTGPFLKQINGFIGFGEEPNISNENPSFNEVRSYILKDYTKKIMNDFWINIANFNGTFQTSKGQKLNLEQYLKYRIIENLKEENNLSNLDIKNMLPQDKTKINECVQQYIARMHNGQYPSFIGKDVVNVNINDVKCQIDSRKIAEKMVEIFNIEHDAELLKEKCKKYNVSFDCPCLNIETVNELKIANSKNIDIKK